ncbi:hypothetical protein RJP21_14635 [Paenibacillus sp. VCA1]|uniref:ATP synthase beta subunit C-terminal domain-containing protein n=1 Tax=Paenibacillus sp. VCA1 TaxID=3039148 RepID=UPI0028715F6A|nr:hypothetical protein [Paenibacillus sp. VCA1]MDR9854848.1 hypothetical protein [Paenibacillus sp. VCA1]
MEELHLNVSLLRARIPNLTVAARSAGLRPATVSNLCTGKIPVGRAEVRTLAALASLAGCTMDELLIRGHPLGMLETGIKVLDLLAPLVKGGTIGLVARQNVGQLALLTELMHRFKTMDHATVFWKPAEHTKGIDELIHEAEAVCDTAAATYERILQYAKSRDVILGADRAMVLSGELFDLEAQLKSAGIRPVTTILVDVSGESVDEELPFGPLDTFLRFDAELTTRGLFPAIDPVASTSVMLEGGQLEPLHLSIQQQARKLMRRYRDLRPLVLFRGEEKLPESERVLFERGERLEAYLSQPFYVAEPFTRKKAEWIPVRDTLEDVRIILEGGADHVPVEDIHFAGRFMAKV